MEPKYEIWGNFVDDNGISDSSIFLEDCFTLEEALKALEEYFKDENRIAYIVDKETHDIVSN